jgi:sphingomyelin phosphodiesterase
MFINLNKIHKKVHIIGHVDPMGCFEDWSKNYYQIVNRYESTITGQFFGHTHYDQFEMFYDLQNLTRAVSVAYIAGSITTFNQGNPNYRIYTVDGVYANSSYQVLDHDSYFMNLTEANLNMKEPNWKKEYSAKVGLFRFNLMLCWFVLI